MQSPSKYTAPSPRTAAPLKGLFKDGIWLCNCRERLPAANRETKKPGPNLGRRCRSTGWILLRKWLWTLLLTTSVYTCQQLPGKQCGFFLWADDAQAREKVVLLSNSRSEEDTRDPCPRTPSKASRTGGTGLLTPQTERRVIDIPPHQTMSPPKSAKARMMAEDTDEFGWDDEGDTEELAEILGSSQATEPIMSQPNFHRESPYKAARTPTMTSPGKRKLNEFANDTFSGTLSPMATPLSSRSTASSRFPPSSAELCMTPTPSKYRDILSTATKGEPSNLAKEAIDLLEKHEVVLPNRARDQLVDLLDRHELKTKGIRQARDMARTILKKKDEEIAALKERLSNLEAQREVDRNVINSMKQ